MAPKKPAALEGAHDRGPAAAADEAVERTAPVEDPRVLLRSVDTDLLNLQGANATGLSEPRRKLARALELLEG